MLVVVVDAGKQQIPLEARVTCRRREREKLLDVLLVVEAAHHVDHTPEARTVDDLDHVDWDCCDEFSGVVNGSSGHNAAFLVRHQSWRKWT